MWSRTCPSSFLTLFPSFPLRYPVYVVQWNQLEESGEREEALALTRGIYMHSFPTSFSLFPACRHRHSASHWQFVYPASTHNLGLAASRPSLLHLHLMADAETGWLSSSHLGLRWGLGRIRRGLCRNLELASQLPEF